MERRERWNWRAYRDVLLLSAFTLIKLFFFHGYMGISEAYWMITLLNGLTALGIYSLVNLTKGLRRRKRLLITHLLLSILFFADTMYFSHFSTLMPYHIFYQVKHLKGVSSSVGNLLRLDYLLYFGDVMGLWFFWRGRRDTVPPLERKGRCLALVLGLLIAVVVWNGSQALIDKEASYYTPFNLGVLNFHLYDLTSLVVRVDAQPVEETLAKEILEEEPPISEKDFFALAKDRNVIVIQSESLQSFVINRQVNGQWITPVLNDLINQDSFFFPRYYEQVGWGNTSDAEFVSQTGLHASTKNFSYKQYEEKNLITLPKVLKSKGYQTMVFHGNEESFWNRDKMYPVMGIDDYISLEDLNQEEIIGMGISDASLFQQAIPRLKEAQDQGPFYSFFITLTSHYPYLIEEPYRMLDLGEIYEGTLLGDYFQTVRYYDNALGEFIQRLKEEGLYENSILLIYGDHHGIKDTQEESELMASFLGKEYLEDEMLRVPFIIHIPGSNVQQEITRVGGQVDFFPTVANLLGIDLNHFTLIGRDLLNTEESYALNQIHTARGSFIQGDIIFNMARDGIFENSKAWHLKTGEAVDLELCREGYERALAEIQLSEFILENNLIMMKNSTFWE